MKYLILFLLICLPFASAKPQQFSGFKLEIHPLPAHVNSQSDDYAPVINTRSNAFFFTSYRDTDSRGEADLYLSRIERTGLTAAVNAGFPYNTKGNDGAISFSADGTIAVFATDGREDGLGDTDLYVVRYSGDAIVDITNLGPLVNSEYWDSQPTLTADGMTLFFVSNRPGGFGGTDIWTTTQDGWGKWSAAQVLATSVNTESEERCPFISPDGSALYFSSDGFPGYGGMDIWMSTRSDIGWSLPQNLGSDINSVANDMFFHSAEEEHRFYFASDREGGIGGLDLYSGTPDIFSAGFFYLSVQVMDTVSGSPLPASVSVYDVEQDRIVLSWDTDAQTDFYTNILPAGRDYIVRARAGSDQEGERRISSPSSGSKERALFRFGPLTLAEFDLGRYNIPFFVSGYYRPNTTEELERLFDLRRGDLRRATYIETFTRNSDRHHQYLSYAATVETIFETVRLEATNSVFPHLLTPGNENEILDIIITGYADPQPIVGRYFEDESISFIDQDRVEHTVREGDAMTNLVLSGLRAWHSSRYLDELFRTSGAGVEVYRQLREDRRIRYTIVGGDVQRDTRDYDVQRRIHIRMERAGLQPRGETAPGSFDLNEHLRGNIEDPR